MKIETKRNIGERLYKVDGDKISFYYIESIKTNSLSPEFTSVKYVMRVNMSAGYRKEVDEDELMLDYHDTPEKATSAVLERFKEIE